MESMIMDHPNNIHNYDKHLAQFKALVERASIHDANKERILAFDMCLAARGYSHSRRIRYLGTLKQIALMLAKPFVDATEQDMIRIVSEIETKPYTAWTKKTVRSAIKKYWKWLKGKDKDYPPEVAWISTSMSRNKRPLPKAEDLLTEQDVQRMIEHTTRIRDKAMISMFWETGARVSELGNLTTRDVRFDKYGAVLTVNGKTGPRSVRIIQSVPYLANWLQFHPTKDQPGAALWVTNSNSIRGKMIMYQIIRKMLRDVARKAGITKRVNPHSFRHARSTFLAKHLTEFQMNQYLGWTQGSDMPSTYVHLSGKEVDNTLFKLNGIQPPPEEGQEASLKPHVCTYCDTINEAQGTFCRKCGNPLTVQAALSTEQAAHEEGQMLAELLKDETFRKVFVEAVQRKKLSANMPLTQVKN